MKLPPGNRHIHRLSCNAKRPLSFTRHCVDEWLKLAACRLMQLAYATSPPSGCDRQYATLNRRSDSVHRSDRFQAAVDTRLTESADESFAIAGSHPPPKIIPTQSSPLFWHRGIFIVRSTAYRAYLYLEVFSTLTFAIDVLHIVTDGHEFLMPFLRCEVSGIQHALK